jgi:hypothetical protein
LGTLSSELGAHATRLSPRPRIYVDANVPAPLVTHMRRDLDWDVLWVIEEDELRRAPDIRHYRLAQQLRRTLVTMDRDYLDDKRFPPAEGGGVLVIQAPNERELFALMDRIDRALFPRAVAAGAESTDGESGGTEASALPLAGRKLHVQTDWGRDGA